MSEDTKNPAESSLPDAAQSADELADHMSDAIMTTSGEPPDPAATIDQPPAQGAEDVVLEEERVKDEIELQIDLLKDPDWAVRREAVVTLGEMGDERCVEPLVRSLRDGDWQVREAAVEALGMVGSPAVDLLIKQLRNWDIRKAVIWTLGKIKDERVLDPLVAQLRSDEFKEDATEALVDLGQPAVKKLLTAVEDKDENVRKQAVIALGRIKDPEAIDALIGKLQDKDWYIRLTAAAALETIGDERGREAIKPLLQDPDLVVKMRAERILAGWKKRAATA